MKASGHFRGHRAAIIIIPLFIDISAFHHRWQVKIGAGRSIQLGLGSKYAVEISGLMFWRAVKTGGCQDRRTPTSQKEGGWCPKTKMIQIRVALPKCAWGTSQPSTFFHCSRFEDKGPTSVWSKVPQTYRPYRRSRDKGRKSALTLWYFNHNWQRH